MSGLFGSSLARKLGMALTGLFLCTFLIVHLVGNSFLYIGKDAFDRYAEYMGHNLFIRFMEIVLFLGFLIHITDALILQYQGRKARPQKYEVNKSGENIALASRMMNLSAAVVLLFLVIHLKTFWVPARFATSELSMYDIVTEAFKNPFYSIFYVVSVGFLFFHLDHGFASAFQTMGINHPRFQLWIVRCSRCFALVMGIGFASFPVYFYFAQSCGRCCLS